MIEIYLSQNLKTYYTASDGTTWVWSDEKTLAPAPKEQARETFLLVDMGEDFLRAVEDVEKEIGCIFQYIEDTVVPCTRRLSALILASREPSEKYIAIVGDRCDVNSDYWFDLMMGWYEGGTSVRGRRSLPDNRHSGIQNDKT